ncbi:MAG: hypothetical protein A2053_01785 [Deltaproteobacteria bacterium GWA2_50_8]|nr:MAG: hypothetical protein A2053_01785 [Deltaproteobacteria bacterium GWA2_50_8]
MNKDTNMETVGSGPQRTGKDSHTLARKGSWSRDITKRVMSPPKESQIITFGDRITYTFTVGKDVGSIHFDMGRGEIFYRGHNISNLDLEKWQMDLLIRFEEILKGEARYERFVAAYIQSLRKIPTL